MSKTSPFPIFTTHLVLGLAGLVTLACGQAPSLLTAQPQPTATARSSQVVQASFNSPLFDYTWATDFSKHTVPLDQIRFIGLERDGITPIYSPVHITVAEASELLIELEPVIVVEVGGEARAYPESTLILHEVVNDTLGGVPIAVTW